MSPKRYHTVSILCALAGDDQNMATALTTALRAAGVDVFEPLAGAKLRRITEEIVSRERVIVIVSQAALADPRVCNLVGKVAEREAAAGGEAFLIPVVIDGALAVLRRDDPSRQHEMSLLCDRVAMAMSDAEPFAKSIQRLLHALEER